VANRYCAQSQHWSLRFTVHRSQFTVGELAVGSWVVCSYWFAG
jgi:hypothetical protein